MSLTLALNNALSGLNVNQQSLQVLSQNITNANTTGYSREIINQEPVFLGGNGAGVSIESITRKADDLLQQTVRDKTSDSNYTSTIDGYLQQAQLLYGQPGGTGALDQNTQTFFDSVQSLSVSPESVSAQAAAVSSATTLAQQISSMASSLQTFRFQADQEIGSSLTTINSTLTDLYKLNSTLSRASASGQSTAGLLDQRDKDLSTLSQYMNVAVTYQEDGGVRVYAGSGIPLVDEQQHALQYTPAPSAASFVSNAPSAAIVVTSLDSVGNPSGHPLTLVPASGVSTSAPTAISSGSLGGLLQVRDVLMPQALAQLDNFAATLRDQVNTIQNSGSGYPGVNSLTGTRAVLPTDTQNWSGSVRIAVLDGNGQPVASPYADETGVPPLTLDLGTLSGGQGPGQPSVQSIIDAINNQFGTPQNKAELGNLNNISLVSQSTALPGASQSLTFDFGLDNISGSTSNFWVTGATVTDASGNPVSNAVTSNVPQFALNSSNTYTTSMGTKDVTVSTQNPPTGLKDGDIVYLNPPTVGSVNGISARRPHRLFYRQQCDQRRLHRYGIGQ